MTIPYLKLNLSQLEHHYHLFYLEKYHNECLKIINNKEFIDRPDIKYSDKYLKSKKRSELHQEIFNLNLTKNLKIKAKR